jgi:hemolysin activation/secretion protein
LRIVTQVRFAAGILRFHRLIVGAALLWAPILPAFAEDELQFRVERIVVDGNSTLAAEAIEPLLAPARGERKSLRDVLAAVRRLQNAYRDEGYAAVQVVLPEQDVSGGVIRIGVIEPKIAEIRVDFVAKSESGSADAIDAADIERILPPLRMGQTPNVRAIDAAVRLANENPARRIQVELEAAAGNDILARVKVETSPRISWFSRLDDTGTVSTGRTRLSMGIQRANISGSDRQIIAQATTSPDRPHHNGSYSFGYRNPFFEQKLTLDLVAGHSDTDTGTTATPAGPLQFTGRGDFATARLARQLRPIGLWEHTIFGGIDYKAFSSICSVGSFGTEGCGAAGVSLTLQPGTVGYGGKYAGEDVQFRGEATYSSSLAHGSRHDRDLFAQARAGATPNYQVFRAKSDLIVALGGGWQARNVAALQESPHPLVTAEQFGLGGANTIRGYGERVQTNDRGWRLTFEGYTPGVGEWFKLPADSIRAVVFHDTGATRRNNVQPGEAPATRLAGIGLGLRMVFGKNFQAQIDWAKAQVANNNIQAGDGRFHFVAMLTW